MPTPVDGYRYYNPIGSLTNTVSWIDLGSSTYDFTKAKSDGADILIYDVTDGVLIPMWVEWYDRVALTGKVWFKAANIAHDHAIYYGNSMASSVSNFAAVFPHGSGFDSDWGDLTTEVAGAGGIARVLPSPVNSSDLRNFNVLGINESPFLQFSDLTSGGIPAGTYSGVREYCPVFDSLKQVIKVGSNYIVFGARRSPLATDKLDVFRCESTTGPFGPFTNFTVDYSPPGTIRVGEPGCVRKYGSTYYMWMTYGWDTSGAQTPGLTIYMRTSADCITWTTPTSQLDPAIWNDQTSGQCTQAGNPDVILCSDGTYFMVVEAYGTSTKWGVYGATAPAPTGPWTAVNSGGPLIAVGSSGAWDDSHSANPKVMQMSDGTYIIQYNGFENAGTDSQIGYATSPNRTSPFTKYVYNPVAGATPGNYGVECSEFAWQEAGANVTPLIVLQMFSGASSSTGSFYKCTPFKERGGLLVSLAGTTDAASAGFVLPSTPFTLEHRSIQTARRSIQSGFSCLNLRNGSAVPAPRVSGSDTDEVLAIYRLSKDFVPATGVGPGDVTIAYYDGSAVRHYWNGSAWSTSTTGRNLATEHGREVIARIDDDGTNYILSATYADTGVLVPTASASIPKASVRSTPGGRVATFGDVYTNAWNGGFFSRYVIQRPYAATDPTIALSALVDLGPGITPTPPPSITIPVFIPAIASYAHEGCSIDHVPVADMLSGDVVDCGSWVGVTLRIIKAGELGALQVKGVISVDKYPGEAIAFGARVFWDAGTQTATGTIGYSEANMGLCVKDALSSDDKVRVLLTPGLP